jgi:hypothetical protein
VNSLVSMNIMKRLYGNAVCVKVQSRRRNVQVLGLSLRQISAEAQRNYKPRPEPDHPGAETKPTKKSPRRRFSVINPHPKRTKRDMAPIIRASRSTEIANLNCGKKCFHRRASILYITTVSKTSTHWHIKSAQISAEAQRNYKPRPDPDYRDSAYSLREPNK